MPSTFPSSQSPRGVERERRDDGANRRVREVAKGPRVAGRRRRAGAVAAAGPAGEGWRRGSVLGRRRPGRLGSRGALLYSPCGALARSRSERLWGMGFILCLSSPPRTASSYCRCAVAQAVISSDSRLLPTDHIVLPHRRHLLRLRAACLVVISAVLRCRLSVAITLLALFALARGDRC